MSRGRVLDESGMSFDEMRKSRGMSREDAMIVLFLLHDIRMMRRERESGPLAEISERQNASLQLLTVTPVRNSLHTV